MIKVLAAFLLLLSCTTSAGAQVLLSAPDLPLGYERWESKNFSCALPNGKTYSAVLVMAWGAHGKVDFILRYSVDGKPFIVWHDRGVTAPGTYETSSAYFLREDGQWLKYGDVTPSNAAASNRASELTHYKYLGADDDVVENACGEMYGAMRAHYNAWHERLKKSVK